jgi:putative endonuclease
MNPHFMRLNRYIHFVYILQSLKDDGWYIGYSTGIERRLAEHNSGKNVSTHSRRPFQLIYYEAYLHKMDALGREKFLKSGAGRRFLEKQIRNYLAETKKELIV